MSTTLSPSGLVAPAVTDRVADTIAALAADMSILNAFYPIGTIYQSTHSTDPSTFLGGTWTQMQDGRTLIAASTAHPAGSTGGEETHLLTVAEMPSHTHPESVPNMIQNTATGSESYGFVADGSWKGSGSTGGSQAHNNMQPYRSVYMWERTA